MSGNLFKKGNTPVQSIPQKLAIQVQTDLINKINEKYPNIVCLRLGSVGHKLEDSGDIDIGVQAKDIDELSNIIHDVFDYTETVENKTIYIISIKYSFAENKYVAVDFILVNDIEYTKFRYYCPDYINGESKYKVGTKIMFIGTILNHCKSKELYEIKDTKTKYEYLPTGLYLDLYEYTTGRFVELLVTTSPQEVVNIMFNNETPNICNTVESIWDAIHLDNFKYPEEVKNIELSFFVNSYRKGWEELVKPEDFNIQYWTLEDIKENLKQHTLLRNINIMLDNL